MMSENESASATAQSTVYTIPGTEVDCDNLPSRPFYEAAQARASGHMTAPLGASKQRDSGKVILDVPNKEGDAELGSRAQRTLRARESDEQRAQRHPRARESDEQRAQRHLREKECNELFCKRIQQAWLCCGVLFVILFPILIVTYPDDHDDHEPYSVAYALLAFFTTCAFGGFIAPFFMLACGGIW
jgi:hypothetical protein